MQVFEIDCKLSDDLGTDVRHVISVRYLRYRAKLHRIAVEQAQIRDEVLLVASGRYEIGGRGVGCAINVEMMPPVPVDAPFQTGLAKHRSSFGRATLYPVELWVLRGSICRLAGQGQRPWRGGGDEGTKKRPAFPLAKFRSLPRNWC